MWMGYPVTNITRPEANHGKWWIAPSAKYSGHVNTDLERQYKSSLAYKKGSNRKGLGS